MENRIQEIIEEQINNLTKLKKGNYINQLNEIVDVLYNSIRNGGKVLIAGNGGSAADSQHFAAEIVGRFKLERKGYPAIALTTDTSAITAIANDYSFDNIFSRQIEALGTENDVFIGISTSGNSKNVIEAVNESKKIGMKTISLVGKTGGKLKEITDICICFDYSETARVQEHHLMTYHIICELLEKKLEKEAEVNEKY